MDKHNLKCKNCGKPAQVVEICPDADDEYFCSQECIDKGNGEGGRAYRLLGVFALNEDGSTGKRLSDMMETKEKILEELNKIKRNGADHLISFLTNSDYFTAPASTKYHGSYRGGLADHSWNVFELLKEKNERYKLGLSESTVILCGLLHDACKINHYIPYGKSYKTDDKSPTGGHGEKSVFILQRFIELSDEEVAMIRWHMNMFDPAIQTDYPNGYAFKKACKLWPGVVALFTADYEATSFIEVN